MSDNKESRKTPLGLIKVEEGTIEHDIQLQEKYQGFNSELLRLALLGITAVGLISLKVLIPEKDNQEFSMTDSTVTSFSLSLLFFGVASIFTLAHRYYSVDSLAFHLESLREEIRGNANPLKVDEKRITRNKALLWSKTAIQLAAICLGLGCISLATAFFLIIRQM